jgi:hypothetical protein
VDDREFTEMQQTVNQTPTRYVYFARGVSVVVGLLPVVEELSIQNSTTEV